MERRSNQAFFAARLQTERQFQMKIKPREVTALFFETPLIIIRQKIPIDKSTFENVDQTTNYLFQLA